MLVPQVIRDWWPEFEATFSRYGSEMYCFVKVPQDPDQAARVVQAFFDLYAHERAWRVLATYQPEFEGLIGNLRSDLFDIPSSDLVHNLLKQRRFVVLQGPPGTGKTRLADLIRARYFGDRGKTIQFHPSVTYEDFVIGLAPDPSHGELRFQVRRGALVTAAAEAANGPYLLVIDEVNRADLGKVLGEAIYLFEAGEVGGANARVVELPHPADGKRTFAIPEGLYVLATMNTADRSIAALDLAIRRRFAFVTMPPDRSVVADQGLDVALQAFDQLADVFVEHAPDDALGLMPGHAYFLAKDAETFRRRVRFELIPLLDDYLRQGLLGAASAELQAVRDSLDDQYSYHASS